MFAFLMVQLQNKFSLTLAQIEAISLANQLANETVEALQDCVSGLTDFDQFIAYVIRVLQNASK